MQQAIQQSTIDALRTELRQKEDENARALAEGIALRQAVVQRDHKMAEASQRYHADVERLAASEGAATGDHDALEQRLRQAAAEIKELKADQVSFSYRTFTCQWNTDIEAPRSQARSIRTIKQQSDTIYELREEVRQRQGDLERLGSEAGDAQDTMDQRWRKENMVANKLAEKVAQYERVTFPPSVFLNCGLREAHDKPITS